MLSSGTGKKLQNLNINQELINCSDTRSEHSSWFVDATLGVMSEPLTILQPGQKARQQGIRRKLSPIASEFKDKVVLLVDDSIVRGNTSREIVCPCSCGYEIPRYALLGLAGASYPIR